MTARLVSMLTTVLLLACGGTGAIGGEGDDTGPGGDDDDAPPGGDEFPGSCEETTPIMVTQAPPPDLLLVVDKSGSMADALPTGEAKWGVMQLALLGLVDAYKTGIRFGLELYPADDRCAAGFVGAGVGSDTNIIQLLLFATGPGGATPIHTSLDAARAYYAGQPVNPAGRYVLLATDGQSNCGDPNDSLVSTSAAAITAAGALKAAGITTYVLGFDSGENVEPATLQAMAQAGGTGNYYLAASPAQLDAALAAIAAEVQVPPCTFTLGQAPPDAAKLAVFFDGNPVPQSPSHTDGWDYDPASNSISFYGPACQALQSGAVTTVRVDYGCGGPVIP